MKKIFFTPGPTEIHPLAKQSIFEALETNICSISHRSSEYQSMQAETERELRRLLSVPANHKIFFISSGTEAWERIIQNAVKEKSFHLVNGSFSMRFYETALELGKQPLKFEVELGAGIEISQLENNIDTELFCLTHNETSTGVCLENGLIENLAARYKNSLIAVDAVSSSPYPNIDLSIVDYYFFSVQKFFSLPAGLGVLIVSQRALEKAKELKKAGFIIGTHHSFESLDSFAKKNQTPCTPNVLEIFCLGRICKHFNEYGLNKIRQETDYKASLIYSLLDQSQIFKAFVSQNKFRSKTVITIDCAEKTKAFTAYLEKENLIVGSGYGKLKDSQVRIANFAAHSVKDFEYLTKKISEFH